MTSPELHATRTLIGKTEDCLYVCLDLDNNNPNPRCWFSDLHDRRLPQEKGKEKQQRCRRLPKLRLQVYTDVVHGNIYVVGGSRAIKDCGEIYNPKIQTWEPLSPSVDLWIEKVHIISVENGKLVWCNDGWSLVRVLEGLSSNSCFPNNLVSVASLGRGGRVAVWWKKVEFGRQGRHYTNQCKTDIWCAEISFEMRPCLLPPGLQLDELWGVVEWSKSVFTFDGCDSGYDFFLHSAIVTL
ncbi:BnaA08g19880D [Brassica napus]|uniref:BnaA08g19880D protein n=1 Tax=Brassica napus TaxID=3708 RepID=A0A078I8M8_BRANA|nr:BnaA08g19880D [Brassica napus]